MLTNIYTPQQELINRLRWVSDQASGCSEAARTLPNMEEVDAIYNAALDMRNALQEVLVACELISTRNTE